MDGYQTLHPPRDAHRIGTGKFLGILSSQINLTKQADVGLTVDELVKLKELAGAMVNVHR